MARLVSITDALMSYSGPFVNNMQSETEPVTAIIAYGVKSKVSNFYKQTESLFIV
jgi:hypothetical protein